MSAVLSCGATRRSASGSSCTNGSGSVPRPKVSQNQPYSTLARCLTRPSRFVPDGVIGRRSWPSSRPSSFHCTTSRCRSRLARRLSFSSPVKGTRRISVTPDDPVVQLRGLGADGGVVAVAGVHHGRGRQGQQPVGNRIDDRG